MQHIVGLGASGRPMRFFLNARIVAGGMNIPSSLKPTSQ